MGSSRGPIASGSVARGWASFHPASAALLSALLLSCASASTEPIEKLSGSLNSGGCLMQDMAPALGRSHTAQLRFYLLRLEQIESKLQPSPCGDTHGIWDGYVVDTEPLGQAVPKLQGLGYHGQLSITNQYSSLWWWRRQLGSSPLRVARPEDADVVMVDIIDDICITRNSEHYDKVKPVMQEALRLMLESQERTGRPHVVPLSRMEFSYWEDEGLLAQPNADKLTFITLEVTDFQNWGMQAPGRAPKNNSHHFYHVIAKPYPSTIHYTRGDPYFAAVRRLTPTGQASVALSRKDQLLASVFTDKNVLRSELKRQCELAGKPRCHHIEAGFKESNSPEGVTAMHELYGRSWFCLMPPGDSHSRRSIYDCLLQDAIPVVFWNVTRDTFPYSDLMDPSQFIVALPELRQKVEEYGWAVSNGQSTQGMEFPDIVATLEQRYPLAVRMQMATNIFRVKHVFQDMLDPVHELVRFDTLRALNCLDDAFTASLKAALRSLCRRGLLPAERCAMAPLGVSGKRRRRLQGRSRA